MSTLWQVDYAPNQPHLTQIANLIQTATFFSYNHTLSKHIPSGRVTVFFVAYTSIGWMSKQSLLVYLCPFFLSEPCHIFMNFFLN